MDKHRTAMESEQTTSTRLGEVEEMVIVMAQR